MPSFQLRLVAPSQITAAEAAHSFYWTADAHSTVTATVAPSSVHLGPNLGALGPVPARNIDLLRIAVAIHCADRSVSRDGGGSNWNRRPIALTIPVLDPAAWKAAVGELKGLADLLTGDDWSFDFITDPAPTEDVVLPTATPARVVLLSGGADSTIGALRSRAELTRGEGHTLVSHFNSNVLAPLQRRVAADIVELLPGAEQTHVQVHLGRVSKRVDGKAYRDEPSNRARSLLFLAIGLAVSSVHRVPLWITENGFASLNPPLGPGHLGSLSTRTTHPAFLTDLSALLAGIGAHGEITNPFAGLTKGEMFSQAAGLIRRDRAAQLLSSTNSCSHTGQRSFGVSPAIPCGVCFGCVVRRAAFVAAGLPDTTVYIDPNGNAKLQAWLAEQSIEQSVRRFVAHGVRARDIIAMGLPSDYSLVDATHLCERGVRELHGLIA